MWCSYLENFWNFYNEIISRVFLLLQTVLFWRLSCLLRCLASLCPPRSRQCSGAHLWPLANGDHGAGAGSVRGRCRAPLSQHYHPTSIHITQLLAVLPSVALLPHRGPNVKRVKHRINTKTWHHKSPKIALCEVNKIWGKLKHRHKVLFFQYFSLWQQVS